MLFFFFSSRRRHTRFDCDWSSDVCSSDLQSTTPVLPEVFDAMKQYFLETFGSPSSLHRLGLHSREALARARAQVASLINAESPDDILFTSSGTESANLAVKGTAYANQRRGNHIVLSEIEHPAVINSVEFLEKHGFTSTRVKVDAEGLVNPQDVRAAINDRTILVCVDRKSTRLNSSHSQISYAVFCLK